MICPYCNNEAQLVGGDAIYPHRPDLHSLRFWKCTPCDAWVGCHAGTERPLGRLANAELRRAKMEAHAAFDPLWKSGQMKRKDAYGWLTTQLGIKRHDCHIGAFDVETCLRVVEVCKSALIPVICNVCDPPSTCYVKQGVEIPDPFICSTCQKRRMRRLENELFPWEERMKHGETKELA